MPMVPSAGSPSSNLAAPSSNIGPSFPTSSNLGAGPSAQYRFNANALNGVPITVLGRSGSPAGLFPPLLHFVK
jgi:hypothetical protein